MLAKFIKKYLGMHLFLIITATILLIMEFTDILNCPIIVSNHKKAAYFKGLYMKKKRSNKKRKKRRRYIKFLCFLQ